MAHERETVVLSPAAAACPPSSALLAHSKRLAWLVACFMEVELRLSINLHAQTPLDSCSVEVAQKKIIHNRWAHLKLIRCRGGNSGNCVTVSIVIGLNINPCFSPGQSKHRPSIYSTSMQEAGGWYQFVQCRVFHWIKLQSAKEAENLADQLALFSLHIVSDFTEYSFYRKHLSHLSCWFKWGHSENPPHPLTHLSPIIIAHALLFF